MDEVDGMSGGDRGGVGELISIIKTSKVPIICICNDKYNQKLKSLRNSTLELDFRHALYNHQKKWEIWMECFGGQQQGQQLSSIPLQRGKDAPFISYGQ